MFCWGRGGSGGKVGESWLGMGRGRMEVKNWEESPFKTDALSPRFCFTVFVSFLFMFPHPDEDVDSRSWRVCVLSQLCTQSTDRTGKGACI